MSPQQIQLDDSNLPDYLRNLGLASSGDEIGVEKAGDGNINWVRRARLLPEGRSWVIKQARPALERFPEYRVSTDRIVMEWRYYQVAAPVDAAGVCPRVYLFDAPARALILEDLGDAERLDHALARGARGLGEAAASIGRFIGAVHRATRDADLAARFPNHEMRGLHGEHIFRLPYRDNDFPLSPALRERAGALARDRELMTRIDAAYARYLEPRGALVHGDVQAGNVLLPVEGPKLLDAEIAHVGDPAFDVGILLAHLLVPELVRRAPERARATVERAWQTYREQAGPAPGLGEATRYAGIELLRRCVGAARLELLEADSEGLVVCEAGAALARAAPDDLDELFAVLDRACRPLPAPRHSA